MPDRIKKILRESLRCGRVIQQTGEFIRFKSFVDFVKTKPLEGLGADISMRQRMCGSDIEALDLIDRAVQGKHGGDRKSREFKDNNVRLDQNRGGSSHQYALRKLRKSRPDLHARVLSEELSVNQAMEAAGLRRAMIGIPAAPTRAAVALANKFSSKKMSTFLKLLNRLFTKRSRPAKGRGAL